jgi:hypothetical protein
MFGAFNALWLSMEKKRQSRAGMLREWGVENRKRPSQHCPELALLWQTLAPGSEKLRC